MRKILVVLLILSVMGGVFAQENNWGKITGEAALSTTLNFAANNINDATMKGKFDGVKLVVGWEKTWDNADLGIWKLTLPIRASQGYFGTDWGDNTLNTRRTKANVTYTLGDFTVTVPFWFVVSNTGGDNEPNDTVWNKGDAGNGTAGAPELGVGILGIPMGGANADVNANWAGELFGFKVGVANLYSNPVVSHAGGYYHFMGGLSQLYVSRDSYGHDDFNVYETKWFRVSDYVLNPAIKVREAPGFYIIGDELLTGDNSDFAHAAVEQYKYHWENINKNGIAYRFFLMKDTLSIGLAFASADTGVDPDGHLTLGNPEVNSGNNAGIFKNVDKFNLIDDWLRHPVFGVKYDNKQLGVSAMVGLEPWEDSKDNSDIYIHAGAYFQLFDNLKINGDLSAKFSTGSDDSVYGYAGKDLDPNFNFGVEISYTNDLPLFAGFGFKMLDLINKDWFVFGTDFIVGFGGAVRDGYKYKNFDDSNAGPLIALKGHVNGYLPKDFGNVFNIGLGIFAGWKNFVLIAAPSAQKSPELTLSIWGELGLDFWFGPGGNNVPETSANGYTYNIGNHMQTSFKVVPSIAWQVWDHGSINFKYELGSDDITRMEDAKGSTLNINQFTTSFKWTF